MEFLSLSEAMARFVPDGAQVALEGFTHLIPFAAGHELIRQGRRDLHLVRMTPDLIYDQLIGAGCARALTFSWGGNPGVGSLHRLRDAVEHGWPAPLMLDEYTHAGMAAAYCAGASRHGVHGELRRGYGRQARGLDVHRVPTRGHALQHRVEEERGRLAVCAGIVRGVSGAPLPVVSWRARRDEALRNVD